MSHGGANKKCGYFKKVKKKKNAETLFSNYKCFTSKKVGTHNWFHHIFDPGYKIAMFLTHRVKKKKNAKITIFVHLTSQNVIKIYKEFLCTTKCQLIPQKCLEKLCWHTDKKKFWQNKATDVSFKKKFTKNIYIWYHVIVSIYRIKLSFIPHIECPKNFKKKTASIAVFCSSRLPKTKITSDQKVICTPNWYQSKLQLNQFAFSYPIIIYHDIMLWCTLHILNMPQIINWNTSRTPNNTTYYSPNYIS